MWKDLNMLSFLLKTYMDLLSKTDMQSDDSFVRTVWAEIITLFTKLEGELNG